MNKKGLTALIEYLERLQIKIVTLEVEIERLKKERGKAIGCTRCGNYVCKCDEAYS